MQQKETPKVQAAGGVLFRKIGEVMLVVMVLLQIGVLTSPYYLPLTFINVIILIAGVHIGMGRASRPPMIWLLTGLLAMFIIIITIFNRQYFPMGIKNATIVAYLCWVVAVIAGGFLGYALRFEKKRPCP